MKHKIGAFRAYAEIDRDQLEVNARDGYRSTANSSCVHAQQYVEKMIKEKIVEFGGDPPRIHNLVSLMAEFERISGIQAPDDVQLYLSTLNSYYFEMRYPDEDIVIATTDMAEIAHEYADSTVAWLETCRLRHGNYSSTSLNIKGHAKAKKGFFSKFRRRSYSSIYQPNHFCHREVVEK